MSDTNDDDFLFKYLDDYPDLPALAPAGSPHIFNINAIPDLDIYIADVVVKILFKSSPSTLTDFLNLGITEVNFVVKRDYFGEDFWIRREGKIVKVITLSFTQSTC